jgi:hypothetical protein
MSKVGRIERISSPVCSLPSPQVEEFRAARWNQSLPFNSDHLIPYSLYILFSVKR